MQYKEKKPKLFLLYELIVSLNTIALTNFLLRYNLDLTKGREKHHLL